MTTTRLVAQHKKEHARYVRMVRRMYLTGLKAQVTPVLKALDRHTTEWILNNLDELVRERPILKAFKNAYYLVAIEAGQTVLDELRRDVEQKAGIFDASFYSGIWKRLVQAFVIENAGDRITKITNTTKERIRTVIAVSIENNEGAYDRAEAIRKELQSPDFTFNRSLSIARTESTTAASYGHKIAAQSMGDRLNIAMGKKWLPVNDNRTRHSHRDMAIYPQIPESREFYVGGELMEYPGDPKGSASNVINCRCRLIYAVLRDSNGRPLPKDSPLVGAYAGA